MKYSLTLLVLLMFLASCAKNGIEPSGVNDNPTAKEMLSLNHDADIFISGGYVFSNAANLDWIRKQDYDMNERTNW